MSANIPSDAQTLLNQSGKFLSAKKSNVFLVLSSETIGLVALSHVGQTDETQTALQASLLSEESPVASCDNPLNIPPLRPLPGATKPIPFVQTHA